MERSTNHRRLVARYGRLSRAGAMRCVLSFLVLFSAIGVGAPSHTHAQEIQSGPTINLVRDDNQDGIPDELAVEVNSIAAASDTEAAIAALVKRLPYSEETRALQGKAEQLQAQITEETSDEETEKINTEIQALTKDMEQDPNYVRATTALLTLLQPKEAGEVSKQAVNFNLPQRGDIILQRDLLFVPAFLYSMWYNHTGNAGGNGDSYESLNGARWVSMTNYMRGGQFVAFARNNKRTQSQAAGALNGAFAQYGDNGRTPFNYFVPDKWTDQRLYCAQLTWKIHKRIGVDLDSNAWQYQLYIASLWGWWVIPAVGIPAVAPDEIWLSGNVTVYHSGWVW